MPRSVKVLELVVAALAGLSAACWFAAAVGPNVAEYGWPWLLGCLGLMVAFEWYATAVALDALFGDDGLVFDLGAAWGRRDDLRHAKWVKTLPRDDVYRLTRPLHPSRAIRRRRAAR